MLNILYLTRVNIGAKSAQSIQIKNMARAFSEVDECNFQLVSSGSFSDSGDIEHKKFIFSNVKRLRYLGICIHAAWRSIAKSDQTVFTRDILVALVVIVLRGRAVYEAHKEPIGKFSHYVFKYLAKRSQFKLISISGALNEYYVAFYSIPSERTLIAHDGVFPEDYNVFKKQSSNELRKKLGLPIDKTIVVHTGSLYKGGAEYFGEFVKDRNNFQFYHVGGKKTECDYWRNYYLSKGITDVYFFPHQSIEAVKMYQTAADLLFYISTPNNPIYWCTSPLKLFEYMASGTPMLCSIVGSVSEIINRNNSLCFDPEIEGDLNIAINDFIENPDGCFKKSRVAYQESVDKYSWSIRASKIIKFLK